MQSLIELFIPKEKSESEKTIERLMRKEELDLRFRVEELLNIKGVIIKGSSVDSYDLSFEINGVYNLFDFTLYNETDFDDFIKKYGK